jgi:uncharacterized protein YutE (UPF0331/DUF86 family)
MTSRHTTDKRELARIRELAREYESKGFKVSIAPRDQDLPAFLKPFQFSPDLIATSKQKSYVVEVTSRNTAEQLRRLEPIVEAIEEAPGWEFILVMTNPRTPRTAPPSTRAVTLDELQQPLEKLHSLAAASTAAEHKYDQAVLMAAWAVIEAALRMYLYTNNPEKQARSPRSLVRDAVMYGFLTSAEGEFLSSITELRNAIAHGAVTITVPPQTLKRVLALCDALAREVRR